MERGCGCKTTSLSQSYFLFIISWCARWCATTEDTERHFYRSSLSCVRISKRVQGTNIIVKFATFARVWKAWCVYNWSADSSQKWIVKLTLKGKNKCEADSWGAFFRKGYFLVHERKEFETSERLLHIVFNIC